ncbi:MAG: MFS transporter [Bacteroidota bacterium]
MVLQQTFRLYKNAYSGLSREVWILSLVSLVNRAGTMVFPFMTIYLTQSMNFSLKEAGYVMSFFGLGSIVGTYIGGWLTDRIGGYHVQFWSLVGTAVVLLGVLRMETFWEMALVAFLLSTAADAFRPANKVAVANYSQAGNRTRSFALLRLATNLGWAMGPAMGGILAAWKGYDWLFYADAITCLLAAAIYKISLKNEDKIVQLDKSTESTMIANNSMATSAYKDQLFVAFVIIVSVLSFAFLQLFYTIPVFFKQELALTERQIGLFIGMNGLLIALFEMPLVYLAERKRQPFRTITLGAFLVGISFLPYLIPTAWIGVALIANVLLTLGEIYWMPFASTFTAERATDQTRGQYMALYSIGWSVASVLAPTLGFLMIEQIGFTGLWLALFLLCMLVCGGFLMLRKKLI